MGSSAALLSISIAAVFILAVSAQQQAGVSWENAPECPDSGTGTAVDTQGRTWGWSNGQSCKYSRGAQYIPSNAAQQQSWDNAPACSQAPTAGNSRVDSLGRAWGWQDGRSCRYTASSTTTPSSPVPVVTWDTASPCGYPATAANSAPDALGRYWGWQNGRSCRFDQPPPKPPSPSPSLVPRPSPRLPPAPAPKQPTQQLPARPKPQPKPKPEPLAQPTDEPAAVDAIPTTGTQPSPEPAPAKAPAKPSPRPAPTKPQPQPEPEPQEAAETPAVPSPKPKGTVVLSSDLEPSPEPQPSPSPSPEPAPLPDITIRVVKESPSPSPNPEDTGLVTITPGVGLPSPFPSPAVADEAGMKQGAADAAAATAAAAAAAAAINATGVIDAPQNFTAPAAAEAPLTSDRAAQQQTDLVLGYQGVPLSEFKEQYATGSLAAVSQVAGVPEADVTQTLGAAPGVPAASAAAPMAPEPTTAAPAPASAPVSQQGSSGNSSSANSSPAVAAESGPNAAAASGANTSTPIAAQDGAAASATPPAATTTTDPSAAASTPGSNATAPPTAAGTGSRKLLRSARNLQTHLHAQQQQQTVAPQHLQLGGTTWHLRRLQGVGDNTYATYAITSPSSSKTARKVISAAKDGTLYQQLQQNGVPFMPSVSLNGNMLQSGTPGRVTGKPAQKGLGAGAVAGIVIGSIFGVALLAGLALLCCWCCTRKKRAPKDSSKAAAVAKAKADLAKAKPGGGNGGSKKGGPGNGSGPSPVKAKEQLKAPSAVPVRKPKNLMDRFATWSAPAEGATAPGTATAPDEPLLTKPGAAAGAGAAAVAAAGVAAGAAAAAGRSDRHSSPGRSSQHIRLRDKYAVNQEDDDDDTFYYQDARPKRYSDAGSRRSRSSAGDEGGLLDGVPNLSSRSSLSQGVSRERGLVTSKIGIAGNPKFVTGTGHNHHGHDSHNDEAPRPMSIKERVERDRQLEAAAGRGAPSDLHSAGGDTSESSWTTSAYTYNSMEPMEKSELAAAAMALQSRRSSGRTAAVTGASHIQQIHIGGRRSPVPGGQSPRVSPLPGRSPQGSPHPGRSPRTSPPRERLPPSKPGATADVATVVPHVARSIQSSATGSVSGKSVEVPAAPPANVGTSVGGNGWLWGSSPTKK